MTQSGWPEHDLEQYRELGNERGEIIRWWRGSRCACVNPETQQHNTKCSVCHGTAIEFQEQDTYGCKALIRAMSERTDYVQSGVLLVNDVQITTMPDELPLGQHDLILLPGRSYRLSETFVKSATNKDKLHFGPVAAILEVKTLANTYAAIDYEVYNEDIEKGYIKWVGNAPNPDTIVSITYEHQALFYVLPDIGQQRRTLPAGKLPQRVFARLKHPEATGL